MLPLLALVALQLLRSSPGLDVYLQFRAALSPSPGVSTSRTPCGYERPGAIYDRRAQPGCQLARTPDTDSSSRTPATAQLRSVPPADIRQRRSPSPSSPLPPCAYLPSPDGRPVRTPPSSYCPAQSFPRPRSRTARLARQRESRSTCASRICAVEFHPRAVICGMEFARPISSKSLPG